jgi:Protein kinase domain
LSENFTHALPGFGPGARVGGYLLQEQVGHGGMAVVFRALDERLGRSVALKILAPALAADEAFRQRFIRESRTAASVDDPHIIPVFEAGEAGGVLFIAMRYVQGGDVRSLLFREGALPQPRVASIVSPIGSALDAAHGAGLIHRDVKPANILLDVRQGRPDHVYLSDFGLSKEALGSVGLTGTGLFLGTVDYAAPEQIDGRQVDGRTDQYALGCAAFEMLCGQPPFRRDQGLAVLHAHLSQPPPSPTSRRPELPSAVDSVFARVLAKSPEDRYRTCGEFGDALRDALGLAAYDPEVQAGHAATEVAIVAADTIGATTAAAEPVARSRPEPSLETLPIAGWRPSGRSGNDGSRRAGWRWPVAIASASAAAVAVAVVVAVIALVTHLRAAPAAAGPRSSSNAGTSGQRTQGASQSPPSFTTALNNVWIAQLAAVPFADGRARLDSELNHVRQQVPGAQVVSSADYGSLTPGYWMILYNGGFSDGAHALAYCDQLGRTTDKQCFGTFLSHDSTYRLTRCYHSAPSTSACYFRL